jgi:hypothetical protein
LKLCESKKQVLVASAQLIGHFPVALRGSNSASCWGHLMTWHAVSQHHAHGPVCRRA